ncbi:MAG: phosphopantetheine-protein [Bacteroidetes bacterium]|nr:MAG: phosphopantetheine-protein [Bacteroidota bacterium]
MHQVNDETNWQKIRNTINALIMTEVYAIPLVTDEEYVALKPLLLQLVPEATRHKTEQFARPGDAQRSLLGEVAARYLLQKASGKPLPEIPFTTGEKGKPVPDGFEGIHLNISHSGRWVAVALSPMQVGVDVEKMRKVPEGVAHRFFSEDEKNWLDGATSEDEKSDIFFTLWTLKESFLKAIGTGLTKNLNSFTVINSGEGRFLLKNDIEAEGYYLKTFPFQDGYKLSACALNETFCKEVIILDIDKLIHK